MLALDPSTKDNNSTQKNKLSLSSAQMITGHLQPLNPEKPLSHWGYIQPYDIWVLNLKIKYGIHRSRSR